MTDELVAAWKAELKKPQRIVVPQSTDDFMKNVIEARENGYDLCCSECGVGIFDDTDTHDSYCSHNPDREENIERVAQWSATVGRERSPNHD